MTRIELLERAKPILFNTEMVRAILGGRKTVTRRVIKPQPKSKLAYIYAGGGRGVRIGKWSYPNENAYKSWGDEFKLPKSITDEDLGKYWTPPCHTDDILYVRETWYYESAWHDLTAGEPDLPSGRYLHRYVYKAENPDYPVNVGVGAYGWKPSIHMPKEAARIFLRVTGVHAERLQNSFFKSGSTIFALLEEGVDIGEQCRECIEAYGSPCCIDDESECGTLDEVLSDYSDLWNSTVKKSDLAKYGWAANPWVWVIEFERVEVS